MGLIGALLGSVFALSSDFSIPDTWTGRFGTKRDQDKLIRKGD